MAVNKLKRHFVSYKILRPLAYLAAKIMLGYKCKPAPEIEGTYVVLANHTMNWDPVLVCCSFKKPMTFIASEHAMRMGFLSKLISTLFMPIQRVKGSTDASAALGMVSMLRKGVNVSLFPEGTRSFDGKTTSLHPTTGRLIKISGASLVTYRLQGGYLTTPRWGKGIRRGKTYGEVVNIYTPEQLKAMTPDEITQCINRDIYENAFDRQEQCCIKHGGKNIAEGLERVLYMCPVCGKIGNLHSEKNRVKCSCGLTLTFNRYGFFEGENVPFERIDKWNEWQRKELEKRAQAGVLEFSDSAQELYTLEKDHTLSLVGKGTMSLNSSGLSFEDKFFPIEKINPSIIRKQDLVFNCDGINYEVHSEKMTSALKYTEAFEIFKELKKQKECAVD